MAWVVEMSGFDKVAAQEKTVRFAMGEGIAFTDAPYTPGGVMKWSSPSQSISIGSSGMVQAAGQGGTLVLSNVPDEHTSVGPLDAMADWVWQERRASIFWVPGRVWAARSRAATGFMGQPVANVSMGGGFTSTLTFQIRDPRAVLETPLQPNKYLGNNVGPAGVEGDSSLAGKPKPIVYGLVSNISPPLVNSSLLIYQVADKFVSILCVRDGGVPLGLGVIRASLASLQATPPAGGCYDVFRNSTGTFIRLGSTPVYGITADADEATSITNQSHANIWSRFRTERTTSTVNAPSVTAAHALDPAGAGFYWSTETTAKAALDEILGSFSGYETQNVDESWSLDKLTIPSGTPVFDFVVLTPNVRMKATSRIMKDLVRVRPDYAPDGSPPFRVNINWGPNQTVMGDSDFAGVVSLRLRAKFSQEYQTKSAQNLTIWDPINQTGMWKNAPEMSIDTGYQPDADGISGSGAQTEADRIMALLGPLRNHFQLAFFPQPGDYVLPGMVVRLTHPRMGLASGKLFRVLQAGFVVENEKYSADLIVGLQV